jgi:flavin reductase (DIM6/NTAB) family NADH-FMN oxidoreductase RutF
MGEAGLLPGGSGVDGAVGWRVTGEFRRPGSRPLGPTKGMGILQLLSPNQSKLVPLLGKMPGWDGGALMKKEECAKLGHEWVGVAVGSDDEEERFDVLPKCASYILIKLKRVTDGGDHDVCIVQVVKTGVWDDVKNTVLWLEEGDQQPAALDGTAALYSGQLRDEGII